MSSERPANTTTSSSSSAAPRENRKRGSRTLSPEATSRTTVSSSIKRSQRISDMTALEVPSQVIDSNMSQVSIAASPTTPIGFCLSTDECSPRDVRNRKQLKRFHHTNSLRSVNVLPPITPTDPFINLRLLEQALDFGKD